MNKRAAPSSLSSFLSLHNRGLLLLYLKNYFAYALEQEENVVQEMNGKYPHKHYYNNKKKKEKQHLITYKHLQI